jgi:hypothetical protein
MAAEIRWDQLSLPALWAGAKTETDRDAARQLIERASQRAVPLVQTELDAVRTPYLSDSLAGLDDELALNRTPAEAQRRLQLLVPTVDLRVPSTNGSGADLLAAPLPCWLQRWLLWPVGSLAWEQAQHAAVYDAACPVDGKSDLPACIQRAQDWKANGAPAIRQRDNVRAAMEALPEGRKKSLKAVTGVPPSPLLTLGSSYVSKMSSRLGAELRLPAPERAALQARIDARCNQLPL